MAQSATIHVDDLLASLPSGNVSDLYEDEQPEIDSLEKEMSRRTESVEGPDLVDALAEEEVEAAVETFAKEGAKVTKLNTGED
ncbi:hypothetical protein BGZ81_003950 [Podila clonocystis]|nr:hypothetical protein BGZ81_003950 [Podila clonocystis]